MDQEVKPHLDADVNPIASSDVAAAASPDRKKKGPPLDLEIFSDDVLRELKKDVLIRDVANVGGSSASIFYPSHLCRTVLLLIGSLAILISSGRASSLNPTWPSSLSTAGVEPTLTLLLPVETPARSGTTT
jgi:hypothetical protein